MSYQVEVLVTVAPNKPKEWQPVCPSQLGRQPYRYATVEEARHMGRVCYPEHQDIVRVVEVADPPNMPPESGAPEAVR